MAELSDELEPPAKSKRDYRSYGLSAAARLARRNAVDEQRRKKREELERKEAELEKQLSRIRARRRRMELAEANRIWRRYSDPHYYDPLGGPKPPGSSMAAVLDFEETLVVGNGARRKAPRPAAD